MKMFQLVKSNKSLIIKMILCKCGDKMDIYLFEGFNQIGLIDSSKSYFFTLNYNKVGEFQFAIESNNPYANRIKRGHTIRFGLDNRKSGVIKDIEIKRTQTGEIQKVYSGKTLGNKLNDFIILPNGEYDQVEKFVEDVMKHYVSRNIRKTPHFTIAPSRHLGNVTRWKARYQNLKEQIEIISDLYNLGWDVSFDYVKNSWVFDVFEGKDRSLNQKTNNPIIFSPENENIYIDSCIETDRKDKNYAYVAGNGLGVNRKVIEVDQTDGSEPKEIFIDISTSENEYIDMKVLGERSLAEYATALSIEGQIKNNTYIYGQDYFIGDTVTVYDSEMGIKPTNIRLISVTESFDENEGLKMFATFGNKPAGLADLLKQQLKVVEPYLYK
jgi:hypothetical protein